MWNPPLFALLSTIFLVSCSSTGRTIRQAEKLEQVGDLHAAQAAYAEAYRIDAVDRRIRAGLMRTSQRIYDAMLNEAGQAYWSGDLDQGEAHWKEAERFRRRMMVDGTPLNVDAFVMRRRNEALGTWRLAQLAEAERALEEKRFDRARILAEQVLVRFPEDEQALGLSVAGRIGPLYEKGRVAHQQGRVRDAYQAYQQVLDLDPDHQAHDDLHQLVEGARYTMAYVIAPPDDPSLLRSRAGSPAAAIEALIVRKMLASDDPFLVVVERNDASVLYEEQARAMAGTYKQGTYAEAGGLLGADYLMTGQLLRYDEGIGRSLEMKLQVLEVSSGRLLMSELIHLDKGDLMRGGSVREQFIDLAGERAAQAFQRFDPYAR
ncbi:MAG: hypothetical protein KDB88_02350 [Flavobacteriales bacterium]|nr:hypothetical protein [Flavobacteriales bacterium]